MNASATELTHTCPRCAGFARAFSNHGHVNSGRCLLCNGALKVTEEQARAFFRATRKLPTPGAPISSRWNYEGAKPIELPTLGPVRIGRTSDGRFALMSVHSESGLLVSTFGIRDGRVWLEHVCGGHLTPFEGSRHELRSELQAALRA